MKVWHLAAFQSSHRFANPMVIERKNVKDVKKTQKKTHHKFKYFSASCHFFLAQITTCKLLPPTMERLSGAPVSFLCHLHFFLCHLHFTQPDFCLYNSHKRPSGISCCFCLDTALKQKKGVASFSYLISVFITPLQPFLTFPWRMLLLLPQFPPIINLSVPLSLSLCQAWVVSRQEREGERERREMWVWANLSWHMEMLRWERGVKQHGGRTGKGADRVLWGWPGRGCWEIKSCWRNVEKRATPPPAPLENLIFHRWVPWSSFDKLSNNTL